jgi:hypothetical protein
VAQEYGMRDVGFSNLQFSRMYADVKSRERFRARRGVCEVDPPRLRRIAGLRGAILPSAVQRGCASTPPAYGTGRRIWNIGLSRVLLGIFT